MFFSVNVFVYLGSLCILAFGWHFSYLCVLAFSVVLRSVCFADVTVGCARITFWEKIAIRCFSFLFHALLIDAYQSIDQKSNFKTFIG